MVYTVEQNIDILIKKSKLFWGFFILNIVIALVLIPFVIYALRSATLCVNSNMTCITDPQCWEGTASPEAHYLKTEWNFPEFTHIIDGEILTVPYPSGRYKDSNIYITFDKTTSSISSISDIKEAAFLGQTDIGYDTYDSGTKSLTLYLYGINSYTGDEAGLISRLFVEAVRQSASPLSSIFLVSLQNKKEGNNHSIEYKTLKPSGSSYIISSNNSSSKLLSSLSDNTMKVKEGVDSVKTVSTYNNLVATWQQNLACRDNKAACLCNDPGFLPNIL